MTMRRSPRRPLILRRRKLPFQEQIDPPSAEPQTQCDAQNSDEASKSASSSQTFPNGIRIMDHPSMSDTQVVVIPKTADLQSVIGALTAKGKECGVQGPNKFILLSESGGHDGESVGRPDAEGEDASTRSEAAHPERVDSMELCPNAKPLTGIKTLNRDLDCGPLDDSLTNIQWLGRMSTCALEQDAAKQLSNKENPNQSSQSFQAQNAQMDVDAVQQPVSERPPYSYMAMIQFAINSRKNRRMTLKEIYMWLEDHFPYFRDVAKPGWKNSIRHNLSLHDMFIRETSPDGKISFWTIRPEANRCLTLDQVYKPGCDPATAPIPAPMLLFPHQQQKRLLPDMRKPPTGSERRIKPLLPRTDSYLVPIQLPVAQSVYLPSSSFPPACPHPQQRHTAAARGAKRVRIAPKVTQSDSPAIVPYPPTVGDLLVKEEPRHVPIAKCLDTTPKSFPKILAGGSRRKQRLVHSVHEEPVLLCPENTTFFDSGVASDASTFHEMRDADLENENQQSPDRDFSFKTPIKSNSHLTSSTPSRTPYTPTVVPEPWKVTPVSKRSLLDFSPIRTPGGPAVTPHHDYTTFSFNSTPFKDLPLFSSPRELLTSSSTLPRANPGPTAEDSPLGSLRSSSCSRELLQAAATATQANRSITEGLVLDTMNDSLSKILVDISFSGLDDEDLGMANISWSEFIPQFK